MRERRAYTFFDHQLNTKRPVIIRGATLVFRDVRLAEDGSLVSTTPYLYFSCEFKPLRWNEKAREIAWTETDELTKNGKKRGYYMFPEGLVACAVSLAVEDIGFAIAIYQNGTSWLLRSRHLRIGEVEKKGAHSGRWSSGPRMSNILRHKTKLVQLCRLSGAPIPGEHSHRVQENICIEHCGNTCHKLRRIEPRKPHVRSLSSR